jgi:hypothetical protein
VIGQYPDMTRLWHRACERLLYADREHLDRWTGLTTLIYDNFFAAKSMALDFDVGLDLWLTKARFPKLQRDYLDFENLEPFFERCEAIATKAARRGVITQMHCRPARNRHQGDAQHVWGNCMLAFTYHGGKKWGTPTIGLHSRVSYIAYLGALDIGLAQKLGVEVARRTGIEIEEMQFRWYIDSLQWHGLKCVPYVMTQDHWEDIQDEERYPSRTYPSIGATRRSIRTLERNHAAGVGADRETMRYGPGRRMNQRYQNTRDQDMPSLPFSSLELLPWPKTKETG